jgi:hypothetical protein
LAEGEQLLQEMVLVVMVVHQFFQQLHQQVVVEVLVIQQ